MQRKTQDIEIIQKGILQMETINPQEWKKDLPAFKKKTDQFYAGELSKADYKGFSGGYGSYAQKDGKASMIRLRMAGGHLTKDKLKFIVDSIEKYNVDKVHLTTCQTIQLHNLKPEAIYGIMEGGLDHGIVTMGGGGDFPRNVTVSPLSGVEVGEYFDVLPYAEAAGEYLMTFIKKEVMPRKLKVGFSNSPANETHATFRDLGFVAREDGNFDVYSAGGLGNNARFGLKVAENVEPEKILYYICAMRETFIAHGNYKQRGRARTRYMQETLGEEGYIKAYQEKLSEVFASGENLDLHVEPVEITKQGDGSSAEGKRVIKQKQEGLYAVFETSKQIKPIEAYLNLRRTIMEADLLNKDYRILNKPELIQIHWRPIKGKKNRYIEICIPIEKTT